MPGITGAVHQSGDAGQTGIAAKLDLAGKVLIFVLCAPMILTLMETITSML
jgi:hypothetical protein